jgi:hypothetical protein
MLTIFGGIAEFERDLIRSRTDEGIERAKRQGKKFGRPDRLDAGQKRVIPTVMARVRRCPSWLTNTASASAPFGGRFNPKQLRRKRKL